MKEYLNSRQKVLDAIKIDERVKKIATPDTEIHEILKPFDDIENDIKSFEESLKSVKYSKPYNPNGELESLAKQQLDVLYDIKQDTSLISNVILLIQKDVANSSKHLELIKETLDITTSSSKVEAESKYEKVLGKINTTVDGVQNIQTLTTWAKVIYEFVNSTFS